MTADEKYVPQVGDRVRVGHLLYTAEVRAVYGDLMWVKWDKGGDELARVDGGWFKVEPPRVWPERWINVYPNDIGSDHWSRGSADMDEYRTDRIGIIHLASDGKVTLEAL